MLRKINQVDLGRGALNTAALHWTEKVSTVSIEVLTGVDEIHLPLRVDNNRSAWMRVGGVNSNGDGEADESEQE